MRSEVLTKIEQEISQLSTDEQLWLIGRLAHHLRQRALDNQSFDSQIVAMAADSQIQKELQAINEEFSVTEMDGLKKY